MDGALGIYRISTNFVRDVILVDFMFFFAFPTNIRIGSMLYNRYSK